MESRILGVDPGRTTGWALLGNGYGVDCGQIDLSELSKTFWSVLVMYQPDAVIMESVVPHGMLNQDKIDQILACGMVQCLTERFYKANLKYVVPQETKQARRSLVIPNETFENLLKGKDHAKDAYCVALAFLRRKANVEEA